MSTGKLRLRARSANSLPMDHDHIPPHRLRHLERVQEAARKAKPRRRGWHYAHQPEQLASVRQPAEERLAALRAAPRCSKLNRQGRPCGMPALVGATRCRMHGGLRQVPDHPGNLERLANGTLHRGLALRAAWSRWGAASSQARQAAADAAGHRASILTQAEGAQAYDRQTDDAGQAWRNWLQSLANQ